MAKPNKDRRSVLEQMRREQERAERKRTAAVIAVAAVVALVIIAAAAYPLIKDSQQKSAVAKESLASLGVPASAAHCSAVTAKKAVGNGNHRPEGSRIPYPDSPPADGPHYPVWAPMSRKFYMPKDRPALGYLVHNLEHGYSILWYDETVEKNDKQLAVVKAISEKFSGSGFVNKFIAAPWTPQDGKPFPGGAHIALTHWSMGGTHGNPKGQHGITQYCTQPSGEVVARFVMDYPYTDSPEPNAS